MLRGLIPLFALLTFAVPAAEAKAPPDVKLCGATGCVQIAQADAERLPLFHTQGAVAPGAPAPYYVFQYRWKTTDPYQTAYVVPSRNLLRVVTPNLIAWYRISGASIQPFTVGLSPLSVPRVMDVTVGGHHVRAPATYVRLLSAGRATNVFPATSWMRVRFTTKASNPWMDSNANVRLARNGPYLLRDDTVFVIPKRLADRARRGLSLH